MSLETDAQTVAEQVRRQEFIEVFAHHDADGIAAAAILCHAMLRAGIRFRLRIQQEVAPADIAGDSPYLLCDLGSGTAGLRREVMVVDHHIPVSGSGFEVKPRLSGIDGDRELSAAGCAYYVAQNIGDNRDLAGLVLAGIIGDGQELAGRNLDIFNEGVATGIITPGRGLLLPGRDDEERLTIATCPYLDGLSGIPEKAACLVKRVQEGNGTRRDLLLSEVILASSQETPSAGLLSLYGDTYLLRRETIEDAHTLVAVIDACGKSGHGDIGAALCLRSLHDLDKAWEFTVQHRLRVIEAVRSVRPVPDAGRVFETGDPVVASDVADILSRDRERNAPVLVYARTGETCRISARSPKGSGLGIRVSEIAAGCGGTGGGHQRRAGATIPCGRITAFVKQWQEALAA